MSLSPQTLNPVASKPASPSQASRRGARGTYLFVLPWEPVHVGGVTSVVINLAGVMQSHGTFAPRLAVNRYRATRARYEERFLAFDFAVLLATTPLGLVKACLKAPMRMWRTLQMLRENSVSVVNFHYPGLDPIGVALLKRLGLYRGKLFLSYHGTDVTVPANGIERWARSLIQGNADQIIACSNSLADRMAREFALPRSRITVVFNGVDDAIFDRDTAIEEGGLQIPEWFVMNVGSFIPRKNHMLLLEAFAKIAPRYPELQLCIAGADGPERTGVEAAVRRLGLADRVRLYVDLDQRQVATLLARAAMCVQPSLAESFPLALLEAAASGAPVVASDIPGHDELIRQRVNGMMFPLGDVTACAAAMSALLDDPGSATTMANVQRAQVREKFTLLSCLREYEQLAQQRS